MTTMMTCFTLIIVSPCLSFLITQHFTHSILFILDCIVCDMGVWMSLIHFPERQWFSSKLRATQWPHCALALSPTSFSIPWFSQIWPNGSSGSTHKDCESCPKDSVLDCLGIYPLIFVLKHTLVISFGQAGLGNTALFKLRAVGRDIGCSGLGWTFRSSLSLVALLNTGRIIEQSSHRRHRLNNQQIEYCPIWGILLLFENIVNSSLWLPNTEISLGSISLVPFPSEKRQTVETQKIHVCH